MNHKRNNTERIQLKIGGKTKIEKEEKTERIMTRKRDKRM